MNPIKNLLNKVFDPSPAADAPAGKEDVAFEWNPDEETVAPTSARSTSWKRGEVAEEPSSRVQPGVSDAAAAAHSLPAPTFERASPKGKPPAPISSRVEAPARAPEPARPSAEEWVRPSVPEVVPAAPAAVAPTPPPPLPLSDFEDVYRRAGIKSPVHGYGVERVYRLLTSRRLSGLDRNVRRSALLTALDAASVPASDVSQDVVLRRKALTAYEAEKALELQSLRSRNESRAEALQDTVETFTRQKQSQIERLAQGSTSAVRAQSDLEIRKRMEQDRLYRSLAYFVEPLPVPGSEVRPAITSAPKMIERFDATIEMPPPAREEAPVEASPASPVVEAAAPAPVTAKPAPAPDSTVAEAMPVSESGLEQALRTAAEEARKAGWGQTAVIEDASDPADALRKLRDTSKPESGS